MLTFSPNEQRKCFNISFPDDSEYEFDEAIRISVDPSNNDLVPGNIPQTDVVISDDDGKSGYYDNTHHISHAILGNVGLVSVCESTLINFRTNDWRRSCNCI